MKFAGTQPLFAIPVFSWLHDDAAFHQELLDEIMAMERTPRPSQSNPNQWFETVADIERVMHIFEKDKPACRALKEMISNAIEEKFPNKGWALKSWVNFNHPQSYHAVHHHLDEAKLSGVYYVSVPENSGALEFVSSVRSNGWFAERAVVKPQQGLLLMFSPSLLHFVHPNKSDKMRVSVGFNAV